MSGTGILAFLLVFLGVVACGKKAAEDDPTDTADEQTTPPVVSGAQPDQSGPGTGAPSTKATVDAISHDAGNAGASNSSVASNSAPTLSITEPNGTSDTLSSGGTYSITYTGADADDAAEIALYYKAGGTGCAAGLNGWTAITTGLAKSTTAYVWNTGALVPGSYFICGVISDGVNPSVYARSPGALTIADNRFVTKWKTDLPGTSTGTQITLPLPSNGTYNFHADWGDGTSDTITAWNAPATTHTYAASGTYTVAIDGTITGWLFNDSGDKLKLVEVANWGSLRLVNGSSYFAGAANMTVTATDVLNLTGITSLVSAFRNCAALTAIPSANAWDVSQITAADSMFWGSSFNSDISAWNVANLVTADSMFRDDAAFNQDLSSWVTSSLYIGQWMFYGTSFDSDISGWDFRHVFDMDHILQNTPFSTAHYDALLISWAAQVTQYSLSGYWFATSAQYSSAAAAAHAVFAGHGSVSDSGQAP